MTTSFSPLAAMRRHGQSLIGLLVVVVLLIGLYLMFLGPRRDNDGEVRPSVAKQSIDRSQEVVVQSNLTQIRQGIQMYKEANDDKVPASLEELKSHLKDYPAEMWINPVDKRPLQYDPQTGRIWSDSPGYEKL